MSGMLEARIRIEGGVQMVGFRYFARREALARGLAGYARNLADGSFETVAQGERREVEAFIEALREGPPLSSVEKVEVEWREPSARFNSFDVSS